jgi:hypothetical protein
LTSFVRLLGALALFLVVEVIWLSTSDSVHAMSTGGETFLLGVKFGIWSFDGSFSAAMSVLSLL